jgi:hypothetical protein
MSAGEALRKSRQTMPTHMVETNMRENKGRPSVLQFLAQWLTEILSWQDYSAGLPDVLVHC